MEGIQDGDGFGQLVADRVGVAAEGIQRSRFDSGGEPGPALFEPVGVGLPGPARDKVQQPGVHHTVGVARVVHDPGDHAGSRWADVGPDVLINPERVHPCQPVRRCDPAGGFHSDSVPDGVPRNAELMGQSGNRGVETLQRIGRPPDCPGREFRSGYRHWMLLGERRSGAVRVRASPDALRPEQPHRPAETRDVVEPDRPAAVAHGNDAAVRTTGDVFPGLDAQNEAGPGRRDRADVDALNTEQRIRARAPPAVGTRHRVIHVRVSFGYWFAWSQPIQRGPDLFPAAPRRTGKRPTPRRKSQTALTTLICEGPRYLGRLPSVDIECRAREEPR